jgi:Sortilin, neurotensin receptor 3,
MRGKTLLGMALALAFAAPGLGAQLSQPIPDNVMEALRWRSIGPANIMGRVTDVEGLPSPSKTFYVASVAGGIFKTTNNGTTFQAVWDNPRVSAMGDLAIAPSDPNQVWAGTGEEDSRNSISPGAGIYKSTDGGQTWTFKGLKESQAIGRIVVNPKNPDIVFVAALGHIWGANKDRGLYRTSDGGNSWKLVKFISDKAGFVDVALDPRDPNVVWAASWERVRGPYFLNSGGPGSGLWKSTDGGDSWTEVKGSGFPTAEKGRIGIAISLSNPNTMYCEVEARKEADGSGGTGLYRSKDGGTTWEKMNDVDTRPFYYSEVRVDPQDENRIYFSSTPLQFSNDGGKTYGTTTNDIHVDDHALWIDPNDGSRMVVGNDGGVAISYDKGGNWSYLNHIAIGQFYHVSYNMDMPYRVCGGLQDNGTWCGPSRVTDRDGINNYHWATVGGGDGFQSAQDWGDPDIVWDESQGGSMGRMNTRTGERQSMQKPDWEDVWRPLQDSIVMLEDKGTAATDARIKALQQKATSDSAAYVMRYNWNTPLLQSRFDRQVVYAGGNRVIKSTDGGLHLKPISPDLSYADPQKVKVSLETTGGITTDATGAETYATVVSLAESPLHQGWLFAGTDDGRTWMTRNDGAQWTELTDRIKGAPRGAYVTGIEPSHFDDDRFYVAVEDHRNDDFKPYLFVTNDGGKTFTSVVANLPATDPQDFMRVIREDPRNPDLLFVGTDIGVYVSTNQGGSWQRFMTGLPGVPVRDLEIHPRDHDLIAATHGRSIWIVGIAPLEQLSDKVVAEGAALFEPAPAFQFGEEPRGGESYGQAWFARPTPGAEAEISYFVGADMAKTLADAAGSGAAGGGDRDMMEGAPPAGARGGAGAAGGARGMRRPPQARITIKDADGKEIRTLTGPTGAGLHSVSWNFRPDPEPQTLSPSQRRDSIKTADRAKVVADSLIKAGWDAGPLHRMVGVFTGETDMSAMLGAFGGGRFGGGGGGRDAEAFQDRPGETPPRPAGQAGGGRGGAAAAMGFDFDQMQKLGELIVPGANPNQLFRRLGGGRRGGFGGAMEGPGSYTVTLTIGDRTFTQELRVDRSTGVTGSNAFFDEGDFREMIEHIGSIH